MGKENALDPLNDVESVHALLATWLGSEASPAVLEQFAATQHTEFSMVTTSGAVLAKADLLAALRTARNSSPDLRIEIAEFEVLLATADFTVVRFLERHHHAGRRSDRRTTAVLVIDAAERRFRWRTLHETDVSTG
ncbi:hypothetical protein AB0H00_04255 [Nocardia sp. NPDC023852]|uniref:hypothetical protein n=1 Tax=Nocardia sp. NPDC023852 TaxID=3154697 RepID=UPI0033EC057F